MQFHHSLVCDRLLLPHGILFWLRVRQIASSWISLNGMFVQVHLKGFNHNQKILLKNSIHT